MKKVLIFGATGMLGHKLYQVLRPENDVVGTIRSGYKIISRFSFLEPTILVPRFDAAAPNAAKQVIESTQPNVVVNCIGVINKLVDKVGLQTTAYLNAEFPHELHRICQPKGIRLIHISTDCVFSGKKGNYKEDDPSDAEDEYGKTKYRGEVKGEGALTLRTSIIGRELTAATACWNGLSQIKAARCRGGPMLFSAAFPRSIFPDYADIILNHENLSGLYNVSSEPISKFALLTLINKTFGLNIVIKESPEPREDRSLDSSKFRKGHRLCPPALGNHGQRASRRYRALFKVEVK